MKIQILNHRLTLCWSVCLSVCLFICFCISFYLPVYICITDCVYLPVCVCMCVWVSLCVCFLLSTCLSLSLFICFGTLCLSVSLFANLSLFVSLSLPVYSLVFRYKYHLYISSLKVYLSNRNCFDTKIIIPTKTKGPDICLPEGVLCPSLRAVSQALREARVEFPWGKMCTSPSSTDTPTTARVSGVSPYTGPNCWAKGSFLKTMRLWVSGFLS